MGASGARVLRRSGSERILPMSARLAIWSAMKLADFKMSDRLKLPDRDVDGGFDSGTGQEEDWLSAPPRLLPCQRRPGQPLRTVAERE